MFTNTLLIYLAFWKWQKTVAKHRRLELSTKRGYGTKRDSSYFMKSQGILTKPSLRFDRGGGWESLSTCHLQGQLEIPVGKSNSSCHFRFGKLQKIWAVMLDCNLFITFQSSQLVSYFLLGRPPITTNFIVLCKLRVVSIFPQG